MKKRQKGFALFTAFALLFILFLLGISFLNITKVNINFAQKDINNSKAYYLARAGLEYYSAYSSGTTTPVQVGDSMHCFTVVVLGDTVTSRGYITDFSGTIISQRTLNAKKGDLKKFNEIY